MIYIYLYIYIYKYSFIFVDEPSTVVKRSNSTTPNTTTDNTVEYPSSQTNRTVASSATPSNETTQNLDSYKNESINNTTEVSNIASLNKDVNNSTLNTQVNSSLSNTTSETKNDSKPAKKSLVNYKSSELPPIYLTEKNGEKMLVVHPTAEFLKSLPRINFGAEDDSFKRTVGGKVDTPSTHVNSDVQAINEITTGEELEDGDDDNDSSADGDSNIVTRSNIYVNSGKQYVSVPVISPDPNGDISNWLRVGRNKVYTSDRGLTSPRTFGTNQNFPNQLGKIYSPDFYQNHAAQTSYAKASRKSYFKQDDSSVQVPKEIQNLFQQYAPGEDKSDFRYAPSQDEVAEELKFAQSSNNRGGHGRDENNEEQPLQTSQIGTQTSPESEYNNQGNEPDSAAANSNRESTWGGEMGQSEGSKRSDTPFVYTKDHVGFGPITVEAKTADAPPDYEIDD